MCRHGNAEWWVSQKRGAQGAVEDTGQGPPTRSWELKEGLPGQGTSDSGMPIASME